MLRKSFLKAFLTVCVGLLPVSAYCVCPNGCLHDYGPDLIWDNSQFYCITWQAPQGRTILATYALPSWHTTAEPNTYVSFDYRYTTSCSSQCPTDSGNWKRSDYSSNSPSLGAGTTAYYRCEYDGSDQ